MVAKSWAIAGAATESAAIKSVTANVIRAGIDQGYVIARTRPG
jgi:hypothetical protein